MTAIAKTTPRVSQTAIWVWATLIALVTFEWFTGAVSLVVLWWLEPLWQIGGLMARFIIPILAIYLFIKYRRYAHLGWRNALREVGSGFLSMIRAALNMFARVLRMLTGYDVRNSLPRKAQEWLKHATPIVSRTEYREKIVYRDRTTKNARCALVTAPLGWVPYALRDVGSVAVLVGIIVLLGRVTS